MPPCVGGPAAHTTHGVVCARRVAAATGAFHVPFFQGIDSCLSVLALHSSQHLRPSELPQGRVLVSTG